MKAITYNGAYLFFFKKPTNLAEMAEWCKSNLSLLPLKDAWSCEVSIDKANNTITVLGDEDYKTFVVLDIVPVN